MSIRPSCKPVSIHNSHLSDLLLATLFPLVPAFILSEQQSQPGRTPEFECEEVARLYKVSSRRIIRFLNDELLRDALGGTTSAFIVSATTPR